MEHVAIEDVEPREFGGGSRVHPLADELGAEHLAINYYRLAPDDDAPSGLHAHTDQAELFVVLEGRAAFETCGSPVGGGPVETDTVTVEAGEAIRFAPGEFQSRQNAGNGELALLALGAPRDSEDVRVPFACPDCGEAALALDPAGEFSFACPACGSERVPADCPECGHGELRATLDGGAVVSGCSACGATFDNPPVRGEW